MATNYHGIVYHFSYINMVSLHNSSLYFFSFPHFFLNKKEKSISFSNYDTRNEQKTFLPRSLEDSFICHRRLCPLLGPQPSHLYSCNNHSVWFSPSDFLCLSTLSQPGISLLNHYRIQPKKMRSI